MCKVCAVPDCGLPVRNNGKRVRKNPDPYSAVYCEKHAARMKRNGTLKVKTRTPLHGMSTIDRFWYYVDKRGDDDCWECKTAINKAGYPGIWDAEENKKKLSHRYSYEIHNGKIDESMYVMHTCDNPRCVNPAHLVVGTPKDNYDDMIQKGRGVRVFGKGENHPNRKLSEENVRYIREYKDQVTHAAFAEIFDVSQGTIKNIIYNRTWRHVK